MIARGLWLCLLVWPALGFAEPTETTAWVSWVMDGDTLLLVPQGQKEPVKVRVDGIDAPESCQPGGEAARDAMIRLAMRKTVQVREFGQDHYGRQVAQVQLHLAGLQDPCRRHAPAAAPDLGA